MYHILLLSRLYTNVNALSSLSWRVAHHAVNYFPTGDSEITAISPVQGNEDNHKVNVENTKITTQNISTSVSQLQIKQTN